MESRETGPIFNLQASETRGGGYKALEVEAIENSVSRYNLEKEREQRMEEAGYDPRILATRAEMEYRGFEMQQSAEYPVGESAQNI